MGRHPGARRDKVRRGRLGPAGEAEQTVDLHDRRAAEVAVTEIDLRGIPSRLPIGTSLVEKHRGVIPPRRRCGQERDLKSCVDRVELGDDRGALGRGVEMLASLRAGIEVEENVLEAAVERRRCPAAIVGQIGPEEKIAAPVTADRVGGNGPDDTLDSQGIRQSECQACPDHLGGRQLQIDRDPPAGELGEVERVDAGIGGLIEHERPRNPADEKHPLVAEATGDAADEISAADHRAVIPITEVDRQGHAIAMELVARGVVDEHVIPATGSEDDRHAVAVIDKDICLRAAGDVNQAHQVAVVAHRPERRAGHPHEADAIAGVGERVEPAAENVDPGAGARTGVGKIRELVVDERDLGGVGEVLDRSETDPGEIDLRAGPLVDQRVELDPTEVDRGILRDQGAEPGTPRDDRDEAPLVDDLADLGGRKDDCGPAHRRLHGVEIGAAEMDLRAGSLVDQRAELDPAEVDRAGLLDERLEVRPADVDRHSVGGVHKRLEGDRPEGDRRRLLDEGPQIGAAEIDLRAGPFVDQGVELDAAEVDRGRLLDQRLEIRAADVEGGRGGIVGKGLERRSRQGDRGPGRMAGIQERGEGRVTDGDRRSARGIDQRVEGDPGEIDPCPTADVGEARQIDPRQGDGDRIPVDERRDCRVGQVDRDIAARAHEAAELHTAEIDRGSCGPGHQGVEVGGGRHDRHAIGGVEYPLDLNSAEVDRGRLLDERLEVGPTEVDLRATPLVDQGVELDRPDGDCPSLVDERPEVGATEVQRGEGTLVQKRPEGDTRHVDRRPGILPRQGGEVGPADIDGRAGALVDHRVEGGAAEVDRAGLLDERLEVGPAEVDLRAAALVDQGVELDRPDGDRPPLVDERSEVDGADGDGDVVGGVLERAEIDAADGDVGGLPVQLAEVGSAEVDRRATPLVDQGVELDPAEVDRGRLLDQRFEVRAAEVDRRLEPLVDERGELGPGEVEDGPISGVQNHAERRHRQIDDRLRRRIDEALKGGVGEVDHRPGRTVFERGEIGVGQIEERSGPADDEVPEASPGQIDGGSGLREREGGCAEVRGAEIGARRAERHRIGQQRLPTVDRAG